MKKIKKLIKELKFDYVNPDITDKNFPDQPRKGFGPTELMKIDREMTTQEILDQMKKDGYELANSYELLEWAKSNWNGKDWVVGLGSQWIDASGCPRALGFWGHAGGRGLHLLYCSLDSSWGRHCLFARRRYLGNLDSKTSLDSLQLRILALEEFNKKVEKVLKL